CLAAGGSQPPKASAYSVSHSVSDCKHSNSDQIDEQALGEISGGFCYTMKNNCRLRGDGYC
ncbi:MAG: hypothetical protein J5965_10990, partial [Aeriscardovia sp.]|nr:hypothetical protein [Aeriscardovia sp.]